MQAIKFTGCIGGIIFFGYGWMVSFWDMQILVSMGFWEDVKTMIHELNVRVCHIYRGTTMVVDFLANQEAQGLMTDFYDASSIQGCIRGLVQLDKLGMPYIRQ